MSLEINSGEFLTLLGPSGSGKTTLLMVLAGFTRPDYGSVKFGTEEVVLKPPHLRDIGMVFQNYALFPHMTVYENLAFPLRVRKIPKDEADKKVDKALSMVSLQGFEARMPMQLSGGQQQRLCIARALAVRPQVLLMDEPCSALDPIATAIVEDLIHELKEQYTIIIVTHSMQQAARVSQKTAFFHLGKLIEYGSTEEIFVNPKESQTEAYITGRIG